MTSAAAASGELLQRILHRGLAFGREDSFKLLPGRVLADRILLGVQRAHLPDTLFFSLADELGMPAAARAVLAAQLPRANAVFFAGEAAGDDVLHKVYLEFWDEVRRRVRGGQAEPQLLHLGVKWSRQRPGHHEEARYVCHPLIGLRDVLRRMRDLYPDGGSMESARAIVRQAAKRWPEAAFLYLEASESGNPRRSFDINLYKAGLRVDDVAAELRQVARHFGIGEEAIAAQLVRLGPLPLGHVSGGRDRRGGEFLSVYAEVAPLPEA